MTQDNPPPPPPPSDPYPPASPGATPPLGYGLAPDTYAGPPPTPDECNMAMLCHLLGIFSGFLTQIIHGWLASAVEFVSWRGRTTSQGVFA
jgi:hypothetical protein